MSVELHRRHFHPEARGGFGASSYRQAAGFHRDQTIGCDALQWCELFADASVGREIVVEDSNEQDIGDYAKTESGDSSRNNSSYIGP